MYILDVIANLFLCNGSCQYARSYLMHAVGVMTENSKQKLILASESLQILFSFCHTFLKMSLFLPLFRREESYHYLPQL